MVYRQVVLTTQSKGDGRFGFGFCAEDTRYLYSQLKNEGNLKFLLVSIPELMRLVGQP